MRPLFLTGALCLVALGCHPDGEIDLERMINQPRYEAYQPSPLFRNGRVLQTPPVGTVSREPPPSPRLDGSIPIALTPRRLARGRDRFHVYCATCHGELGNGESAVATHMSVLRPPSLHGHGHGAFALYDVITQGFGLMPSYLTMLSWEDRWSVVAYVQALLLSQAAPLYQLPPADRDWLLGPGR